MIKDRFPHQLCFSDEHKKAMVRAAVLLGKETWAEAITIGMLLVTLCAEAYAKGKTSFVFCTLKEKSLFDSHPDFFKALCEEGVIEWLTPFVLGKSTIPPEENQ